MSYQPFSDACHLPANVDNAYALLTSKQAIEESYTGRDNVAVLIAQTETGHSVAVTREVHIGPQAPAMLRGVLRNRLTLSLRQDWVKTPEQASAAINYQLLKTPISIIGNMQLTPASHGSTLSAKLQAHVRLPIVGKQLAVLLAKAAAKKIEGDFYYQRDELLRRGNEK